MLPTPFPRPGRVRTTFSSFPDVAAAGTPDRAAATARRGRLCPSRHLTVDTLVRLYDCIAREGGVATLDEIRHALPDVARPVSGVLDLCDAGLLRADLDSPFDGDTRVWRLDR